MTKEEPKKILTEYVKACREDDMLTLEQFAYEEVIEAMDIGAEAISVFPVSSGLEDAAEKSWQNSPVKGIYDEYSPFYKDGFIAGAEWKEKQLLPLTEHICKVCQKVRSDEFQKDLYERGRKSMKEDMMDEAVEGTMYEQPDGTTFLDCQVSFPEGMFHHEDKVKLIVVKEDQP